MISGGDGEGLVAVDDGEEEVPLDAHRLGALDQRLLAFPVDLRGNRKGDLRYKSKIRVTKNPQKRGCFWFLKKPRPW